MIRKISLILFWMISCLAAEQLSHEVFLGMLIDSHPVFKKETLTTDIERQAQLVSTAFQDWRLSTSFSLYHEEQAINFSGPDKMNTINADVALERTFWSTGAKLQAGYESGFYDLELPPIYDIPPHLYRNMVTATYTHPLLRNKNGFINKLDYNLKQFDIDYSKVVADERCEDFLCDASVIYLRWVFLDEQLIIMRERLRIGQEELVRTNRRYDARLIDKVDVFRAKNTVFQTQQHVVSLQSRWRAAQAELAELAGNPDIYNAEPAHDLYSTIQLEPPDQVNHLLQTGSRLIRPLLIRLDQFRIVRQGIAEENKSDLSLYAMAKLERVENKIIKAVGVNAPTVEVGLRLNIPLEKRTANAELEKNQLLIKQLEYSIADIQRQLKSALTALYVQVEHMQNLLQLNKEHIEATAEKTKQELKLYELGRGDLTFVLQSRDEEQAAKLVYAENAYHYQKLLLQYRALMDQLYGGKDHERLF